MLKRLSAQECQCDVCGSAFVSYEPFVVDVCECCEAQLSQSAQLQGVQS